MLIVKHSFEKNHILEFFLDELKCKDYINSFTVGLTTNTSRILNFAWGNLWGEAEWRMLRGKHNFQWGNDAIFQHILTDLSKKSKHILPCSDPTSIFYRLRLHCKGWITQPNGKYTFLTIHQPILWLDSFSFLWPSWPHSDEWSRNEWEKDGFLRNILGVCKNIS